MKRIIKFGVSAFLLASVCGSAMATTITGPYVEGGAGADITQTQHSHYSDGSKGRLGHNNGFTGFGAVGWGFGNGLRAEVEGDYFRSYINRNTAAHHSTAGNDENYGGFVNVLYDIDLKKNFNIDVPVTPFVGVGAGYLWDGYNVRSGNHNVNGTQGSFAYQGIVGAAYDTGIPGLQLTTEYRMVGQTMSSDHFRSDAGSDHFDNKFNHQFIVGVRYAFNNAPPPPVPAPLAIPAPEAARMYLVFFDWDSADLTPRARDIVGQAAMNSTRVSATRIEVTGYSDNTSIHGGARGEAYNQKLSLKRAEAVEAALIADGIDKSEITVKGLGEKYPMIIVPANTREPHNRRVEIVLK